MMTQSKKFTAVIVETHTWTKPTILANGTVTFDTSATGPGVV